MSHRITPQLIMGVIGIVVTLGIFVISSPVSAVGQCPGQQNLCSGICKDPPAQCTTSKTTGGYTYDVCMGCICNATTCSGDQCPSSTGLCEGLHKTVADVCTIPDTCGDCVSNWEDCDGDTANGCEKSTIAPPTCQLPAVWDACNDTCDHPYVKKSPTAPQSGYLTVTGASETNSPPVGSLFYNTTAGKFRVKTGTSTWADVGKTYGGVTNQIQISYDDKIGFALNPIIPTQLTVQGGLQVDDTTLVVNSTNNQVGIGTLPVGSNALTVAGSTYMTGPGDLIALGKVKLGTSGNVGIGIEPDTTRKLKVAGATEFVFGDFIVDANTFKVGFGTHSIGIGIDPVLYRKLKVGGDIETTSALTIGTDATVMGKIGIGGAPDSSKKFKVTGDGVITNLDVNGDLKVGDSGAFGTYGLDSTWKVTTPNLNVGPSGTGTIIGVGAGQGAGDIKTGGRIVVSGTTTAAPTPNGSCSSGQTLLDFNEDGNGDAGELCYTPPNTTTAGQGFGVFGGRLHTSKLLSSTGGLSVAGPVTLIDTNMVIANGNIIAKQLSLLKSLSIAPAVDSADARLGHYFTLYNMDIDEGNNNPQTQYAIRIVDEYPQTWLAVWREGYQGMDGTPPKIRVKTDGMMEAKRVDAQYLALGDQPTNISLPGGYPSGTRLAVQGKTTIEGDLTVQEDLQIGGSLIMSGTLNLNGTLQASNITTGYITFDNSSTGPHLSAGTAKLRIGGGMNVIGGTDLGSLNLSGNAVFQSINVNGIITAGSPPGVILTTSTGALKMAKLAGVDFNSADEGYMIFGAKDDALARCNTICTNHGLICFAAYTVSGGSVSDACANNESTSSRRYCWCKG